ncbi:MAG: hypothetical protein QMD71_07615 [bacterium]|nr:hypothetical protein [bacterium]
MEFLLLGGMILLMGLLNKVEAFKKANRALIGLKLPIGIVVIFVGLSSFAKGARFVFPAIMGVIAGIFLIMDLLKLIPKAEESVDKVDTAITGFQVPVGVLTAIAAIIGLFMKG